tara:strand:- start:5127 stop:6233 length:1107 start_codon:yes stop_codon:yes gene_type:complete
MIDAQQSVLEINLNSLEKNYYQIKSFLSKSTIKLMAVVKANGYGGDSVIIAKRLEKLGIDYFAVAYACEGVELRNAGIKTPILVLIPQAVSIQKIVKYNLEPSLYSFTILERFLTFFKEKKLTQYPVHIKLNTGLNRVGFNSENYLEATSRVVNTKTISVKSIYSHLAASEDANELAFSKKQIELFNSISSKIISILGYKPILHLCNTSGLINFPEAHYDMVRSGIGLYGFSGNEKVKLSPVHRLKSIISQIHRVKKNESIGYNRSYFASKNERIAIIPIGHADGLTRVFGNKKGFVFINGEKAFIVGNVCMDVIMVDVTSIECNEGDQVIIFDEIHTAEQLCNSAGTISYELISSISINRISRLIVK